MSSTRPLAHRRLDDALEQLLLDETMHELSFSAYRRKLALISHEKRFILFLWLMRQAAPCTDHQIATAVRDLRTNVVRNLYALMTEQLVRANKDPVTGIIRYEIDRSTLAELSELFRSR